MSVGTEDRYEIHVAGVDGGELDVAFPRLARRMHDDGDLLTGPLSDDELSQTLRTVRALGGRTLGVVRLD